MCLVEPRGDRTVIEPAIPGAQVRQRDVGPAGQRMHPFGVDAPEPHAAVVGDQDIPRPRTVVPCQAVDFRPVGGGQTLFAALTGMHDHRITAVRRILDPRHGLFSRRGIEGLPFMGERPGTPVGKVHIAELRVDPLFEERRAAVFGPPDPATPQRRAGGDQPGVAYDMLPARAAVEHHEPRDAGQVALHGQHRRVTQRQRPLIGRMVVRRELHEGCGAVLLRGQRRPEALQRVERGMEQFGGVGLVELAQGHARRGDHIGVAGAVPGHLVPDVLAVALPGIGTNLVPQFIVVGNIVAVGAAEPPVDVAAVGADAPQGAVGHREGGLQPAAERRHHRLGHHRVALEHPDRKAQKPDRRALLSEHVARHADQSPVEVVVLHGMAVLVGHELLVPRHRVAVDGRRGKELHALGEVHHQPVGAEVLGVHDEGQAHRAVAESIADRGTHGIDVEERAPGDVAHRVGIEDLHVGRAQRRPLLRRIRSPGIILRRGVLREARRAERCEEEKQSAHVRNRLFCSGNRRGGGSRRPGRGGRPG